MHRLCLPRLFAPAYLGRTFIPIVLTIFLPIAVWAASVSTPRRAVENEYHGVKVTDPYQWLEKTDDPEVVRWTAAQNRAARNRLDSLSTRTDVEYQLSKLFGAMSANYWSLKAKGSNYFALRTKPTAQQAVIVTFTSLTNLATERTVVDPNQLDPQGGTSIDFFEPSRDGRFVAVSLSELGSEAGTIYVFEVATGRKLNDVIPRVQFPTGGGSVAWNEDGSVLYYTRYPAPAERSAADLRFYQQVYRHRIGAPTTADTYEIGKDFPRIAETVLKSSDDGRYLLASVANGDGGEYAYHLRQPNGAWRQVAGFKDGVQQVEFGRDPLYLEWPRDTALYLLSRKDAPRGRILRLPYLPADQLSLDRATEVIKSGTNAIASFMPSSSGLYIEDMIGGPSSLRFHDFFAKVADTPAAGEKSENNEAEANKEESAQNQANATNAAGQEQDSASSTNNAAQNGSDRRARGPRNEWTVPVQGLYALEEMFCRRGDELVFRTVGYTAPYEWQVYDPASSRTRARNTALDGESPADFRDVEVLRVATESKDGTRVPMTILRRKGTRLDGRAPTLLTGYGGFGISTTPHFEFSRRVWFDQGGILAIANIRGGGEFGEEWHLAGNLERKQNVFDDFIACAEFLVRSNYTSPARLAIEGGSNGGLLMGAVLTQRPDLFRAVVAEVGLYDMLRVELDPNGQFNTTEYGSVRELSQFKALYGYSPYHRVTDRTPYPAVLFMTGDHDGRVNPAHSRKMTARLQAATSSRHPILLRTSARSGHGMGTALDERIAQLVDKYAFLFEELGVEYSDIARGPWAGAMTPTTATIKARLIRPGQSARLVLSTSPSLWWPRHVGPSVAQSNHYNVVEFNLDRLKPDTEYYYGLEVDGRMDHTRRGQFHTFPIDPKSFSFAFASCARTGSTSDIFDTIRKNQPLFYMNIGDFHYLDLTNSDIGKFREAYDLVLSSPQQSDLYRSTAFFYMWDDHDYGGNNANKKALSHAAVRAAYREYVPHYPLAAGDGDAAIYQSFDVGRAKFIVTDLRSERDSVTNKDDSTKSMMGEKQKAWFKQELLAANGKYPVIFWVSTVPWLGQPLTNYYRVSTNDYGFLHHLTLTNTPSTRTNRETAGRGPGGGGNGNGGGGGRGGRPGGPGVDDQDHWSVFATERQEICDFIKEHHIQGLAILHGDSHMLAADDGSNGDFATGGGVRIPVMCGAPLDQSASLKGGPYSQGVYRMRPNEGGFGFVTVTDLGDQFEVKYSGRNNRNEEKVSLRYVVPGTTAVPSATSVPAKEVRPSTSAAK